MSVCVDVVSADSRGVRDRRTSSLSVQWSSTIISQGGSARQALMSTSTHCWPVYTYNGFQGNIACVHAHTHTLLLHALSIKDVGQDLEKNATTQ